MGSGAQATPTPHQEGNSAATRTSGVAVTESHPDDTLLIVGGYTDVDLLAHTPCVKSRFDDVSNRLLDAGVHVLHCSGRDGSLTHLSTNAIGPNVAFIARSPVNPDLLYASTERIDAEGEIITLRLTESWNLVEIHRAKAGGRSTCYLNFNRSKQWLMAVNYWDAKISTMALDLKTGLPLELKPSSILARPEAKYVDDHKPTREEHWKYRQKWAHSHCAVTEPYHGLVHFVVDLGLDKVFAYRVDACNGVLVQKGVITLPKGKGPRHLVFHPTKRAAYLVNELDSTVSCFKVNTPVSWTSQCGAGQEETSEVSCLSRGAPLELVTNLSSLPASEQGKTCISSQGVWKAASHSSEIRIHPGGEFFVVGNRGHDSVAVFKATDFLERSDGEISSEGVVTSISGGIELIDITPSGGECPRNFNWAANGKFLVVGNQNSSAMCVFAFDNDTGFLLPKPVSQIRVVSPNYVFAAPLEEAGAFLGARGRRHTREDSVMSMQTQTIVVEEAVAGDAQSVQADAVAAGAA